MQQNNITVDDIVKCCFFPAIQYDYDMCARWGRSLRRMHRTVKATGAKNQKAAANNQMLQRNDRHDKDKCLTAGKIEEGDNYDSIYSKW